MSDNRGSPKKPWVLPESTRAAMLKTLEGLKSSVEWCDVFRELLEIIAGTGDKVLTMAVLAAGARGNPLVPACEEGRQRLVHELLELGASPGAKGQHGEAPIHVAALGGFRDIVAMLVAKHEAGKDCRRDEDGCTALFLASEAGHLSTVEVLLGVGADPTIIPSDRVYSAFDVAAGNGRLGVVKAFGRFGAVANVDGAPAGTANSALHLACNRNQAGSIELLIQEFGADPDSLDGDGCGGLHLAAVCGHSDAIDIMLQHDADPLVMDSFGRSALQIATENGSAAAVEALCSVKKVDLSRRTACRFNYGPGDDNWSALDFAARGGHVGVMEVLVAHGGDVNAESAWVIPPCTRQPRQTNRR